MSDDKLNVGNYESNPKSNKCEHGMMSWECDICTHEKIVSNEALKEQLDRIEQKLDKLINWMIIDDEAVKSELLRDIIDKSV